MRGLVSAQTRGRLYVHLSVSEYVCFLCNPLVGVSAGTTSRSQAAERSAGQHPAREQRMNVHGFTLASGTSSDFSSFSGLSVCPRVKSRYSSLGGRVLFYLWSSMRVRTLPRDAANACFGGSNGYRMVPKCSVPVSYRDSQFSA